MERISKAAFITVAVVLIAGVAGATVPDANGVLHGCTRIKNGALRVVEPGQGCRGNETPITWNQEGPQGPVGPANDTQIVRGSHTVVPDDYELQIQVACPGAMVPIGGTAWVLFDWIKVPAAVTLGQTDAEVDWEYWHWFIYEDPEAITEVAWNITCGSV